MGCAAPATAPAQLDQLTGMWQMVIDDLPIGARIPTLSVGTSGGVSGRGPINRYQATLDVAALGEGQFLVGPPRTTRMAGPPQAMGLEREFLSALAAAREAVFIDGELVLRNGGGELLRFRRVSG